jgi:SAM-dependent methyltransferase
MDLHTYAILFEVEADHWWHSSRREIVLDQVAQLYPGRTDLRLLDAGCGTGLMLQQLKRFGMAEGVDISEAALDFCRQRGLTAVHEGDLRKLPFPDQSLDVITALDVIEHMEDDGATLREFGRVLKPGGRCFIFVPAHKWLWSLQDDVSHHYRRYTRRTLADAVRRGGLRVERETYVNAFLLPVIFAGRLALRVVLRFRHDIDSENGLHPGWSNGLLGRIFRAEIPILRRMNLPLGASLLCVARKES